jgi:hypothetical protein
MHTGGATRAPSGSSCGAVAVRQELRGELLTGEACRQAGGAAWLPAFALAERSHHQIPASGDPVNGFFRRPAGGVRPTGSRLATPLATPRATPSVQQNNHGQNCAGSSI